ncbi:universal stress protein [Halopiger xanaduensis]|nr:universal stress protein [Halopiger xanaduensis]
MFDTILVPVDGSECSDLAVDYAADLARRYDATVYVATVIDVRLIATAPQYDHLRSEATALVDSVANRLEASGVATTNVVRTAKPYQGVLMVAEDYDADLIIMGTHGRSGVDRYLLGSVTERVIRRSDVPVLTVRTRDDGNVSFPYDDVLVPTDGSDGAEAAYEPAIALATAYDAMLHALSVIETNALGLETAPKGNDEGPDEAARMALEEVEANASQASAADVVTEITFGSPHEEIRSYVREHDIDLVVMGTHGRSGLPRYLLGSVAEKLVRTASVPVMTVRKPS